MDASTWNTLLFVGKWLLIILVYLFLFAVMRAVRREMAQRVSDQPLEQEPPPGNLRVIKTGREQQLQIGQTFPLQPETLLGSEAESDIILTGPYISRRHAQLRWDGKTWWVEDLGSRNGTFVNGAQVLPYKARPFPRGAVLQVGDIEFEIAD